MSQPAPTSAERDAFKRQAAELAVTFIQSGMALGLGSGSTSIFAVRRIGELIQRGELRDVRGLPSSEVVAEEARRAGVPLFAEGDPTSLDLTIDGADEVDPDLNLIKGGGGALTREKIVAQASRREIIIVDETKLSPRLGTRWPVPIEVLPFAWHLQEQFLAELGSVPKLRAAPDGSPYRTDQGNFILDCNFGPIADPVGLAAQLAGRAGIVEHGLFLGLTHDLIVAGRGGIEHRQRPGSASGHA